MPGNHISGCACMGCLMQRVQERRKARQAFQQKTAERAHIDTPLHPKARHHRHETGMLTVHYPDRPYKLQPYCYTCRHFYKPLYSHL
jgi:hypothetical protein